MRVLTDPETIFEVTASLKNRGKSIGFVPTMGALHLGHLSLVEASLKQNNVTVVSIFVNPLQFNKEGDLVNYPRTLAQDQQVLEKLGVDFLFAPSEKGLYPTTPVISIDFGEIGDIMEGKYRLGHFSGVGIVISKLFHFVQPDRIYFGLKDLQQFLVIKKMCQDLGLPVEVVGLDTVREKSGLAMSSRNLRLSSKGKEIASNIYAGLNKCRELIINKEPIPEVMRSVNIFYDKIEGLEIEYVEIVDAKKLQLATNYRDLSELAVCIAGYVEGIRLIDNLYLRLK